ncbi:MAG: RloB domain-containing protein [Bacillota bacterium]|nr:RloB domain-containing protein [Bacillota bacterium]
MANRRPPIKTGMKVCIVCEGYEEFEYIEKLISLNVWDDTYNFHPINAESNGKIPARYQDLYANDIYDIILIFCDTDQKPFEDYATIKDKINKIHGVDNSAELITVFANPCTMQIILLHFDDIRLTSHKKSDNKSYIKSLTGIGSYQAKKKQRTRLFSQITADNYLLMSTRSKDLSTNDTEISSSNFNLFINRFSSTNTIWISDINSILES